MDYSYIQTDAKLMELAQHLGDLPKNACLALDTETSGLDPLEEGARILLLQVGTPEQTWVVNACKCNLGILKPVLESRLCILQNAKFDYKWLKVRARIQLARIYDTQIAEMLLNAGLHDVKEVRYREASLKSLVMKYCGVGMDKAKRKDFVGYVGDEFSKELLDYAAGDIPFLFPIKDQQTRELMDARLVDTAKTEFAVLPVVGDMELNGLGIDVARYQVEIDKAAVEAKEKEEAFLVMLRETNFRPEKAANRRLDFEDIPEWDFNMNATKSLVEAFAWVGILTEKTNEDSLMRIDHPFAAAILEWRKSSKVVSMYGEVPSRVNPATGRVHAEFHQNGSDAGRFSSDNPNVQQLPEHLRWCFVPRPGNVIVDGDWAGMELRILGQFSQDESMLAAFRAGLDMHRDTAARMFGTPYEAVTKEERQRAKIINFATIYGMGPATLVANMRAEGVHVTEPEARDLLDKWFAARPGAKVWLDGAANQAIYRGECRTLAGRRRLMPSPQAGENYKWQVSAIGRKGKNTPIQGSNACILKECMVMVDKALREAGIGQEPGNGLVACVHDELVLEVRAEHGEAARELLERCMVAAGERYLTDVPVVAEVAVSDCWKK